jgi:ADP-L-glycero-D-manno-heptose 6-epimerase
MRYIDNDLKGKRVLVTGGAGFVGKNIAFYFQENHPEAEVTIFDRFRSAEKFPSGNFKSLGHYKNLLDVKGRVICGDINNRNDLDRLKDDHFDIIFHQAAISDTTVEDQELMMRSNTNSFIDLLEIAKQHKAKVVYASSAGTYGNGPAPNKVGQNESPVNVYGFSKLMMDNIARSFVAANPTMHVVGLRYFNVYGGSEYYKGTTASMILQLGLQALRNKKVRLFKYGEQKRDFIYIKDVVQANIKSVTAKSSGVFNVGTGVASSFNDIAAVLKSLIGDFEVEYFDNPYGFYQEYTQADITSSKDILGYVPAYPLKEGITDYYPEIAGIFKQHG